MEFPIFFIRHRRTTMTERIDRDRRMTEAPFARLSGALIAVRPQPGRRSVEAIAWGDAKKVLVPGLTRLRALYY